MEDEEMSREEQLRERERFEAFCRENRRFGMTHGAKLYEARPGAKWRSWGLLVRFGEETEVADAMKRIAAYVLADRKGLASRLLPREDDTTLQLMFRRERLEMEKLGPRKIADVRETYVSQFDGNYGEAPDFRSLEYVLCRFGVSRKCSAETAAKKMIAWAKNADGAFQELREPDRWSKDLERVMLDDSSDCRLYLANAIYPGVGAQI